MEAMVKREFKALLVESSEHVATIRLNRPERKNALDDETRLELIAALKEVDESDDLRVTVLTGAGDVFCAGADLSGGARRETALDWYKSRVRTDRLMEEVRETQKPVIAAINGACLGAGFILAGHCDILVASDRARFGLVESRAGSCGGAIFPFLIGAQWTKFMMLAGQVIGAERAREIGFVIEVIPHDELMLRVRELALQVAAMPAVGVLLNKSAINRTVDLMGWALNERYQEVHGALTNTMAPGACGADGRNMRSILREEGVAAFIRYRDSAFDRPWLA
jgi:enoyl-CoA hydratase